VHVTCLSALAASSCQPGPQFGPSALLPSLRSLPCIPPVTFVGISSSTESESRSPSDHHSVVGHHSTLTSPDSLPICPHGHGLPTLHHMIDGGCECVLQTGARPAKPCSPTCTNLKPALPPSLGLTDAFPYQGPWCSLISVPGLKATAHPAITGRGRLGLDNTRRGVTVPPWE
jgi:hypothetical protein